MASQNEPGLIKLEVERAGLGTKTIFQYRTDSSINAGKSPDGVLANLTTDKWVKIPKLAPILRAGDVLRLKFKSDAADGIDVSDCVVNIPFWIDGTLRPLNLADFSATDITECPAGGWIEIGTGYTIPADVQFAQVGGGDIVISIEDDTS